MRVSEAMHLRIDDVTNGGLIIRQTGPVLEIGFEKLTAIVGRDIRT